MDIKKDPVDEKLPLIRLIILGLQHVLVMYAGAIAVPLILGSAIGLTKEETAFLIKADLFTCGIATILQSLGVGKNIGVKLPVMLGVTFVAVAPMINIGQHLGIQYIYGAILISGVIVFVIAPYFCRIVEFFPPIVIGSILTTIGINLLAVAMDWVAGGVGSKEYGSPFNILLASSVTVLILIITKYSNDFFKSISVLCGLVAGSVFAYFAGHMSIAGLSSEKLIGVTTPFWFGYPKFDISAVLTMIIVAIISMIESSGVFFAIGKIVDKEVKNKDLANGFRAEGLAITLGSILNSFPYTTFSQNVGLLVLTRIKSRFVTVTAGLILIILGLFPKLAYIVACLPPAVLGGAGIIMFGMVAVTGISMLHEVNYKIMENLLIVATSIGIGVGVSIRPAIFDKFPKIIQVIISDGVFMACIVAIALNFFFNHMRGNKKCN